MRRRKVRVDDDATSVRPVSAPAILHTKANMKSDDSQKFLGVLVFRGQLTYDENLVLNVCVHHFSRYGCFELTVFRQTRRKGVWCQFYLKERPILDQIEPRKLKMLSQQKVREKVPVATAAGPTKVTCQQALVLARYCLVRDIIQQHLCDIINYEISRMYLSSQAFSDHILLDPFGRPVQGRDYCSNVINLLMERPVSLETSTEYPEDQVASLSPYLHCVSSFIDGGGSLAGGSTFDQCSSVRGSVMGNQRLSPSTVPLRRFSNSSQLSVLSASSEMSFNSTQARLPAVQARRPAMSRAASPGRCINFDEEDEKSIHSIASAGSFQDELSISKFATKSVLSEYQSLSPSISLIAFQDYEDEIDRTPDERTLVPAGLIVQPSVELLSSSLSKKSTLRGGSDAHVASTVLELDYNCANEQMKQFKRNVERLEPVIRSSWSPLRPSSSSSAFPHNRQVNTPTAPVHRPISNYRPSSSCSPYSANATVSLPKLKWQSAAYVSPLKPSKTFKLKSPSTPQLPTACSPHQRKVSSAPRSPVRRIFP